MMIKHMKLSQNFNSKNINTKQIFEEFLTNFELTIDVNELSSLKIQVLFFGT